MSIGPLKTNISWVLLVNHWGHGVTSLGLQRVHGHVPDQSLVVQVPHSDVSIGAAGEADLGVGADGQSVARGRRRRQLRLYPRSGCGQIPDWQSARLAPDDESPPVRKQSTGADVVISVLMWQINTQVRFTVDKYINTFLTTAKTTKD